MKEALLACVMRRLIRPITIGLLALAICADPVTAAPLRSIAKSSTASGFTVIALVTTNPNWLEKWQTTTPGVALKGTDTLQPGDYATLIVLFSNAVALQGKASIKCDVTIKHDPAGSGEDQSLPPTACYDDQAPPANVLGLTALEIRFNYDSADQPGLTQFDIGLTDDNGGGRAAVTLLIEKAARK
jgi:hypothetical protein